MTASLLGRLQGYRIRDPRPYRRWRASSPGGRTDPGAIGTLLAAIGAPAVSTPRMACWRPKWWAARRSPVPGCRAKLQGVIPGARVVPATEDHGIPVACEPALAGSSICIGQPLDGPGPSSRPGRCSSPSIASNPLARRPIHQPMDVGADASNAVLTVGA